MILCICSEASGMKKNLHIDTDTDKFVTSEDHGDFCLGRRTARSVRDIARLLDIQEPSPPKKHLASMEIVNASRPMWSAILSAEEMKKFMSSLVTFSKKCWDASGEYEKLIFPAGNEILFSLDKMKIDTEFVRKHMDTDHTGVLRTFLSTEVPRYNRFASVTGRMSITSGPDIARLRKDMRKIILPESEDRAVYQLDMVSLEPSIALLIDGQRCPDDIYTHLSKSVLGGEATREVAKAATICALYGISAKKLSERIPKHLDATRILGDVRSYFNITGMLLKLKKQAQEGSIKNFFGREVEATETSPLVNYFLQSSGVDASLLAFSEFRRSATSSGIAVSPKGVIHDALIFTAERSSLDKLIDISRQISVPKIGNMRAKITEVM